MKIPNLRREVASPSALRLWWAWLVVGIATLAILASCGYPVRGVTNIDVTESGVVFAVTEDGGGDISYYQSVDGGMAWEIMETSPQQVSWRNRNVDTPMGRFTLDGPDVMWEGTDGEQSRIAYTTAYLDQGGNSWAQLVSTRSLGEERAMITEPESIGFDQRSGNLVIALGLQGVVVGTPGGEWTRVPIARYTPTDFSFWAKTRMLTRDFGFWITVLTVAAAMTGASLVMFQYRTITMLWAIPAGFALGVSIIVGTLKLTETFSFNVALFAILFLVALVAFLIATGRLKWQGALRALVLATVAVFAVLTSMVLLLLFGWLDYWQHPFYTLILTGLTAVAGTLTAVCFKSSWSRVRIRGVVAWAVAGMTALIVLSFMLCLHTGISDLFARFSAVAICGVVAIVLASHIRRTSVMCNPNVPGCRMPL